MCIINNNIHSKNMLDICKNKFIEEGLPKGFLTFNQCSGSKPFFVILQNKADRFGKNQNLRRELKACMIGICGNKFDPIHNEWKD